MISDMLVASITKFFVYFLSEVDKNYHHNKCHNAQCRGDDKVVHGDSATFHIFFIQFYVLEYLFGLWYTRTSRRILFANCTVLNVALKF